MKDSMRLQPPATASCAPVKHPNASEANKKARDEAWVRWKALLKK